MPAFNLKKMTSEQLFSLRGQVEARIVELRRMLEKQLSSLGGTAKRGRPAGNGRSHPLKGKKVKPKYRGPGGKTWSGRGLPPKWMAEALKTGKSKEDFLIAKGRRK
jgi:DNA-binding protein H-NS